MSVDLTKLPIQFGPYFLKQKIASGGMAEIYLAEATGPGGFKKPLVIKMIHHAYSDDKRFLSMFTEEAKILSSLTHGNIVPIFDFGTANGLLYLAMEFIDGVDAATLMEICRTQGIPLPTDVALFIGIGTAAGLSHAHQAKERGIVHRDVSPQNILLSRSGEVKLCDFGLATHTLEEISSNEAIKGKLKYLSPEQAKSEPVDGRSDLFSLGVVLYELIVGHHPVPSGNGVTVLQELAGGEMYPPLQEIAPWIPSRVAAIIDRAVTFDKKERFQSGEEMRSALSMQLHKDFPTFTPAHLAELVVRVQTVTENSQRDDDEHAYRAKIASFASSTRVQHSETLQRKASSQKWRKRAVVFFLVIGVVGIVGAAVVKAILPSISDSDASGEMNTQSASKYNPTDGIQRKGFTPTHSISLLGEGDRVVLEDAGAPSAKSSSEKDIEKVQRGGDKKDPRPTKMIRATGTVHLNAAPWANVTIDGVRYATTPILNLKLKVGKHRAVFVNPELGITRERTFVVRPDEVTTIVVEME
jgi:serine/threonine protein kinase